MVSNVQLQQQIENLTKSITTSIADLQKTILQNNEDVLEKINTAMEKMDIMENKVIEITAANDDLTRKLDQLRQEKVQLEHTLEQEQECLVLLYRHYWYASSFPYPSSSPLN